MADKAVHLAQAKHNEQLAGKLLEDPPFQDWAITAAFYSAVHYIEGFLFDRPEQHTETSIPVRDDGEFAHTAHVWREKLVERRLGRAAHKAFRTLHVASEQARYLSLHAAHGSAPRWLTSPASQFFDQVSARKIVLESLKALKYNAFGSRQP